MDIYDKNFQAISVRLKFYKKIEFFIPEDLKLKTHDFKVEYHKSLLNVLKAKIDLVINEDKKTNNTIKMLLTYNGNIFGIFKKTEEQNETLLVTEEFADFISSKYDLYKFLKKTPYTLVEGLQTKTSFYLNGSPVYKDAYNNDLIKQFKKIGEKEYNDLVNFNSPVPLFNIDFNIYKSLEMLNIDIDFFKQFCYNNPYTGYQHLSILPIYVFIKPEYKNHYRNSLSLNDFTKEVLFDKDIEDKIYFNDLTSFSNIKKNMTLSILLGEGYTESCMPNDGTPVESLFISEYDHFYLISRAIEWKNK